MRGFGMVSEPPRLQETVGGSVHLPLPKSLKSTQLQPVRTGRTVAFLVSSPWEMYFEENI